MALTGKGRLPLNSGWCSDIKLLYQPIVPESTNVLSVAIRSFFLGRNKRTNLKWWSGDAWEYPPFLQKIPFNQDIEDEDYSGITFRATVDSGVEFGDILYLDGSTYKKANATDISKAPVRAMAIEGAGTNKLVMRMGFIRSTAKFSFSAGQNLWLTTTDGEASATQPSTTNNVVQAVGWAYNVGTIYFEPSQTYLELL